MSKLSVDETPNQKRTRSIDANGIIEWEPDYEEKELIKLTWSDDFNFLYELGANIYCYIFERMPECKALFPKIHKHGDENYQESSEFRSQSLKFVQTLSHAVKNLYNMRDLAVYLHSIGQMHVKFSERGFKPKHWDIFLDAIETSLAEKIASIEQFDEEQRQKATRVWRRLSFFIVIHMKRGYNEKIAQRRSTIN
ncbi:GLOBIN domain-containing protein [Aphelenchoides bicaudatus]|nr:GLOBIN domain-containing protein [Aphelenchoides bicaudatus]